ncbi:hypothetical protein AGLY_009319 [Aphis glycines]|uniref:Uncharacterized protein n=1 Tax=Aphis glycines TaxID=307491 RepID=A0A6G0TI10_APHGL|nr:hypothetical protein AGLY_009319 [Aphis glycines]
MLHLEERFDRFDFGLVRVIGQRASFCCQSTSSHPFCVLLLLYVYGEDTYAIAFNTHLGHAIGTGHFQLNAELVLRNIHIGCHLASLQTDTVHGKCADFSVFRRFVHPQMQISACEPIPFKRFQCKLFGPIQGITNNSGAWIKLLTLPCGWNPSSGCKHQSFLFGTIDFTTQQTPFCLFVYLVYAYRIQPGIQIVERIEFKPKSYSLTPCSIIDSDESNQLCIKNKLFNESGLLAKDVSREPFNISSDVTLPFISGLLYPFFQVPFCCGMSKKTFRYSTQNSYGTHRHGRTDRRRMMFQWSAYERRRRHVKASGGAGWAVAVDSERVGVG